MGRYDTLLEPSKPPAPKSVMPSPKQETPQPEEQTTHLHANLQTRKDASTQTSKPVNPQASKPASIQTDNYVMVEKYSTYLTPACKKGLKRIAFETDRKDYEVLIEAVEQYLESKKQPQ